MASHVNWRLGEVIETPKEFRVSFWDPSLGWSVCVVGCFSLFVCLATAMIHQLLAFVSGGLAVLCFLMAPNVRIAVSVTSHGVRGISTLFGLRVRTRHLGSTPTVSSGLVWDWGELSLSPSEAELRAPLHDHERFVVVEYADDEQSADKEREVHDLAQRLRAAISSMKS